MTEEKIEEKAIMIKKSDLWKYTTFVLVAVVVIGAFFMLKDNSGGGTGGTVIDTGTNDQAPINANALIESNDPVLGDKNAGISISSSVSLSFSPSIFSSEVVWGI